MRSAYPRSKGERERVVTRNFGQLDRRRRPLFQCFGAGEGRGKRAGAIAVVAAESERTESSTIQLMQLLESAKERNVGSDRQALI